MGAADKLLRGVRHFEDAFVIALYALMAILPVLEAILRRFVATGIPGEQVYVQHLTMWVGFWGAALAAREERHLSLSTSEFFAEGRPREVARLFSHSVAAAVSGLLAFASAELVQADMASPSTFATSLPLWTSELIMPVALGLVCLRLVLHSHPRWWGRVAAFATVGLAFVIGTLFEAHAPTLVVPCAVVLLAALLLGAPVYAAMAGFAMLLFYGEGVPISAAPAEAYRLVTSAALPAVPLLTMAGYVLAEGGAAGRLVRVLRAWLGWFPGGSAVVVAGVCAIFTTLTGGSGVTILALGGVLLPILQKERYPEGFSIGLLTASGSLGLLFWPSVPVLLYSVVAHVPVTDLYLGGFLPGALMVVLVAAYGIYVGRRAHVERTPYQPKEAWASLWAAKWDLGLPVLVGGALVFGFATMVEAAALAVAYAVVVECAVYRDVHPTRELPVIVSHAGTLVGSVVILLGMALGLTGYLVDAEVPAQLIAWTTSHIHSKLVFLLALNVVLLVLGSVLEIYGAIIILSPLLAPLAVAYGIDPVHLGVVFLANLEMGFLFPPFGLNLFLSASRFRKPLPTLYRQALPFLVIIGVSVLVTTYLPAISSGVVKWFREPAVATSTEVP